MDGDAMSAGAYANLSGLRDTRNPNVAHIPKQRDLIEVDTEFGHCVQGPTTPSTDTSLETCASLLAGGDHFCLVKL